MSKCSSGEVKKRKPRTSFDENDKRIFLNIIKNSEGGRFAKVITSKDSESESSVTMSGKICPKSSVEASVKKYTMNNKNNYGLE